MIVILKNLDWPALRDWNIEIHTPYHLDFYQLQKEKKVNIKQVHKTNNSFIAIIFQ